MNPAQVLPLGALGGSFGLQDSSPPRCLLEDRVARNQPRHGDPVATMEEGEVGQARSLNHWEERPAAARDGIIIGAASGPLSGLPPAAILYQSTE